MLPALLGLRVLPELLVPLGPPGRRVQLALKGLRASLDLLVLRELPDPLGRQVLRGLVLLVRQGQQALRVLLALRGPLELD